MHKIIDIEERIPSLKNRKKKRKNIRLTILLIVLGMILLILLYFQLPISHVKKINVHGNSIETEQYYIDRSHIKAGESLWTIDTKEAETSIKSLDFVQSVEVTRKWLNEVDINVVENKKVAILKTDDRYNYILENGRLLPNRVEVTNYNLPIVINMPNEDYRKKLMKQLLELDPDIIAMISQIEYKPRKSNNQIVQLYMNDGFEVKADLKDLANKLQYYPSIVAQLKKEKKGVINLEIGGYYNSYKLEYK